MKIKESVLLRRIVGSVLVIMGIAGLALPIIPGWIFIFIGLELFGINLIFFDKIKAYVKERMKKQKEGSRKKDDVIK